jgi:hypothetical protein
MEINKSEMLNLLEEYRRLVEDNFDRLKPTPQFALKEIIQNSIKSFGIKEYYKEMIK